MKYISTILCFGLLLFIIGEGKSQTYSNEWIDLSKDHYKIKIAEEGVYRISKSVLESNGILTSGAGYKMYTAGKEVPLYVSNAGQLGSNDFIEFYADKLDGSFDTQLFEDPKMQLHPYISQFTDTAVYFLLVNPNVSNLRLNETNNSLSGAPAAREYFIHQGLYVGNNSHSNGVGKRFSGVNVHFSEYEEGEGWMGNLFAANNPLANNSTIINVPTPNIYLNGPGADIEMKVLGISDDFFTNNDHTLQVKLNGDEIVFEKFEGYTVRKYEIDNYALTKLSSPATEFEMSALGFASSTDKQATSYIAVDYPRTFNFSGINQLLFNLETDGTTSDLLEIIDFPTGGVAPVILDLLNNIRIEGIVSGNTVSYHLPAASNKNRKLFIYQNTGSIVKQVTQLNKRTFIDYSKPENQGDYIIISHTNLMKDGSVDEYAAYRESVEGGNHKSIVADVELLYDQFSQGIRKHPLSIKNFMQYAADVWQVKPKNLFLIGKSIKNSKCRTSPIMNWPKNLVPTYGDTPSDMQFVIPKGKVLPTVAVGRLSAFINSQGNSTHVRDYLAKVREYETANVYTCNELDLDWKKQVLHISGGDDLEQQRMFNNSLNKRERIIEDTLYGGFVHRLYKQGGVIDIPPSEYINYLINDLGLGLICFYGHASGLFWEVDVGHAKQYTNKGKYPFILANSCFVGDIHKSFEEEETLSMSEEWVLEANAGAIGYLAGVQFGFPPSLDEYTESIYRQISYNNYNGGIGESMVNTINEIYRDNEGILITSEEMVLEGDPAIVIGYTPKPEFEVKNSDIFFEPALVSTRLDSFRVNVVLSNYGTYNTADSITLCIERKYEDGTTENISNPRFVVPSYQDTLSFNVYTDPLNGFGENEITVKVDCNNELEELCEDNNISVAQLFITADNLVPVNPCEFSIMSQPDFTLQASTASPILLEQDYVFQMDTTEQFNSSLLNEGIVSSAGGIVEWNPGFNFSNPLWQGVVFYWRVAKVDADATNWRNSSFIYNEDLSNGWNQSHYYQYDRGTKSNDMSLNEFTRQFEYQDQVKNIKALTGYVGADGGLDPGRNEWASVDVEINNVEEVTWSCLGEGSCTYDGGVQFVVLNPATFNPLISKIQDVDMGQLGPNCFAPGPCCDESAKGIYGNVHCRPQDTPSFDFETKTIDNLQSIINFLDEIPNGHYVLIKSIQNHKLDVATNPQVASYLNNIYNRIEAMGGTGIKNIQSKMPFLLFLRKGVSNFEPEIQIGTSQRDILSFDLNVESKYFRGAFESTLVGPADEWQSLFVKTYNNDPSFNQSDEYTLNIYGVRSDGRTDLLTNGPNSVLGDLSFSGDELITSLSKVNAIFYPYIKLELVSNDEANNTPPQLDYWRVLFDGVTELAFNTGEGLVYEGDTLFLDKAFDSTIPIDTIELGESFNLSVAIQNVSGVDADSILVVYEVVDATNTVYSAGSSLQAPLAAGEKGVATGTFSTNRLNGVNYLYVKLNPIEGNPYYQREKFGFNNILILPFYIGGDNTNPLLDVTFDGEHILDGDIVATQPEIAITVRDDNPFLALDDPSIVDIVLTYPDGSTENIQPGDSSVIFIPANIENLTEENVAQLLINRHFTEDGIYCLQVNAEDAAGNSAGDFAYKISFEVDNSSSISHIYNYPNPFSTSTQFLFTITGLQVPEVFKIQILTVGGKIVREIDKAELGNLHIGRNITDYKWDGKDEYGGNLGNGVYLFRIVSSSDDDDETGYYDIYAELNAEDAEKVESRYSKSGFGKMYIMR